MTGTRPDNDTAFTSESEFRFIHNEYGNNDIYDDESEISKIESEIEFQVTRFMQSPDAHEANSVEFDLNVYDAGLETENYYFELSSDFSVVFDDLKYIVFDGSFDSEDVDNFSITDYSYDETTSNLKFSFSFDIDGDNPTGNDLSVSGTVDVFVFEAIGEIDD